MFCFQISSLVQPAWLQQVQSTQALARERRRDRQTDKQTERLSTFQTLAKTTVLSMPWVGWGNIPCACMCSCACVSLSSLCAAHQEKGEREREREIERKREKERKREREREASRRYVNALREDRVHVMHAPRTRFLLRCACIHAPGLHKRI